MSDVEKNSNLHDFSTMAIGIACIGFGLSVLPAQIVDGVFDGHWERHIAKEAEISCRSEFRTSFADVAFPMDKDVIISAQDFNECYEQELKSNSVDKKMSVEEYVNVILAGFMAIFGSAAISSGVNNIRKSKSKQTLLKPN